MHAFEQAIEKGEPFEYGHDEFSDVLAALRAKYGEGAIYLVFRDDDVDPLKTKVEYVSHSPSWLLTSERAREYAACHPGTGLFVITPGLGDVPRRRRG
ncbi:MAG TPA: hypothetical protein VFA70_10240 [Dehalococcoidia bacterium]|jgi:hypothetical protein|nr:hypothetical protein [Dehalococcoidia bacterium]